MIEFYDSYGDIEHRLQYKGEIGEYVKLSDSYGFKEIAPEQFDSVKINSALKEYWEEQGF